MRTGLDLPRRPLLYFARQEGNGVHVHGARRACGRTRPRRSAQQPYIETIASLILFESLPCHPRFCVALAPDDARRHACR